ncbi:MAG: AtpZ/AtpI family protein [Bacteroidia bacterium]
MKQKKQQYNNFIAYSSMAMQMILVLVVCLLLGMYADKHFKFSFKWFTVLGVFAGLVGAFYLAFKDLLKKK